MDLDGGQRAGDAHRNRQRQETARRQCLARPQRRGGAARLGTRRSADHREPAGGIGRVLRQAGARVFNLYKPPQIIASAVGEIRFWRDRLYALWPEQADHVERWLAHRAQRPGEKINHALVLGGKPGIGKDAVLDPLKRAVGPWNFAEISPQAVLGNFNEFARSAVLRISERKDLGDIDRFAFYEATKTLTAAPPDTLGDLKEAPRTPVRADRAA